MKKMRLGVVDFANSRPLVWTLEQEPEIELIYDHPAAVADLLQEERIDAGLVPLAAHFSGVGMACVPGVSIASVGPVWSVKLFGAELPTQTSHQLFRVGVDHRSRSSVALLRMLLEDLVGPRTEFTPVDAAQSIGMGGEVLDPELDAVLAIGDLALCRPGGWDLGAAWHRRMGLPFVYALWVTARLEDAETLGPRLRAARDEGLRNIDDHLRADARIAHLDSSLVKAYLTTAIDYRLTDAHREGMELFRRGWRSGVEGLSVG